MADNVTRFGTGLFGLGALPGTSREDYLSERQKLERTNAAAEAATLSNPLFARGNAMLARAGATLGQGLQKKYGEPFSNQEEQAFAIKEQGLQNFQRRLEDLGDEAANMPVEKKRQLLMNEMASAALAAGDMQTFNTIAQAAAQQSQQYRLNEANINAALGKANTGNSFQDIANDTWSPTVRQQAFDTRQALEAQLAASENALEPIKNLIETTGTDPDIATKVPGGIITFLRDTWSAAAALGDVAKSYLTGDGKTVPIPSTAAGQKALAERDPTYAAALDFIQLPPQLIDATADARAKYKSQIIGLAYSQWRQNEGSGSRQASDKDILLALDTLGANSGDVRTIAGIIMQRAIDGVDKLGRQVEGQYVQGASNGLPKEYVDSYLYGGSMNDIYDRRDKFLDYGHKFIDLVNQQRSGAEVTTPQESDDDFLSRILGQ
jgi:hypothetical protein